MKLKDRIKSNKTKIGVTLGVLGGLVAGQLDTVNAVVNLLNTWLN